MCVCVCVCVCVCACVWVVCAGGKHAERRGRRVLHLCPEITVAKIQVLSSALGLKML